MTTNCPQIIPPPNLLQRWMRDAQDAQRQGGPFAKTFALAAINWAAPQIAAQAADQELEACCEWLQDPDLNVDTDKLRAARRPPEPPSLKAQALAVCDHLSPEHAAVLRRALEQLDD